MVGKTTRRYWDPLWLRKPVLFTFMALFIVLSVSLILLWHFANRYDGIPLALTTNHYAWTYGPTAVLTVVVSLWRQVNYCAMVSQPWQELHDGPQEAEKTVLLDYVWPLQMISFLKALRNRHLAVATSILILTLLKLVMVISTTLFVLGTRSLSQEIRVHRLTKFDAAKFLNALQREKYQLTKNVNWDYANMQQSYRNTTPPLAISTAFTNYSIDSEVPGSAITASVQVDVFQANVTCEIATVNLSPPDSSGWSYATLNTPSCKIRTRDIPEGNCTETRRYFLSTMSACQDTTNDYQHVILTVEISPPSSSTPTPHNPFSSICDAGVRRMAAISCDLEYSIYQGVVHGPALDTSRIDSLQVQEKKQGHIGNVTGWELLYARWNEIDPNVIALDSVSFTYAEDPDLLSLLVNSRTIKADTFDALLDAVSLQSRAEEVLAGVSHQVMRRYLLLPDDTETSGSINFTGQRLYIRTVVLWTMVGLLVAMSCLVAIVIAYTKPGVTPQSPATIASTAYVMSRSPAMDRLLRECSAMRLSGMRKVLANYHFLIAHDRVGMPRIEVIEVTRPEISPEPPSWLRRKWKSFRLRPTKQVVDAKEKGKRPWMPYSGRSHAITLTLILPTITIVALEVLWYLSENNEQFVTVSSDSNIATYAIRYGSTAVALLISTLFNSLDFAITSIAPFSALTAGDATAEHAMLFAVVGDLPPVALYKAILQMHIGVALSLVASTVGSLLTIAISGLWFDTTIEISRDVTVDVQSAWNINFDRESSVDNDTINYFDGLENGSPDEATLIWDNVVLPRIGNPQPSITSEFREILDDSTVQYDITVPAIRPSLDCSVLPPSSITFNESMIDGNALCYGEFNITAQLVAGCSSLSSAGASNYVRFALTTFAIPDEGKTWFGYLHDLPVIASSDGAPLEGCPSLGAVFGTYEYLNSQSKFDITPLICTQRLQWVEVNATYPGNLSSLFAPNLTTNLRLNSTPARSITDTQTGSSSLSMNISAPFERLEWIRLQDPFFDIFFEHLITGPSPEKLLGRENSDALRSAMNDLYQRFMVHVIDRQWRSSVGHGNVTPPNSNGRVARGTRTATVLRLKLSKASKILLQSLLSTMVVLGGLAWWCVDLRVLPRNPYPIASSMALFAGSRLIQGSSQNLRSMQGHQNIIKRKPLIVLKGKRFRLGWWKHLDAGARNGLESDSTSRTGSLKEDRRFGIDVEDTNEAGSSASVAPINILKRR
ncbi:hypothetical protein GGR51DRAFT_578174 [Nemania sp. FL0031]|nr:hypothetical protein GGR51DRAFT_578174 [Nemania sp. FL0031]